MKVNTQNQFTLRVYGLVINTLNEVLLSDEYMMDTLMTKFPGGGLHWGESTLECLHREFMEECGQEIEVIGHFYTTDYFQTSFFNENLQVISIYYLIKLVEPLRFKISIQAFDFAEMKNGSQSFRWMPLELLKTNDLTFQIDQKVGKLLKAKYLS